MNNVEKVANLKILYSKLFKLVSNIDKKTMPFINIDYLLESIENIINYLDITEDSNEKILLEVFKLHVRNISTFLLHSDSSLLVREEINNVLKRIGELIM